MRERARCCLFISAAPTVQIFYLKDVVGASDTAHALLVCRRPGRRDGPADGVGDPPARIRRLGPRSALLLAGLGPAVAAAAGLTALRRRASHLRRTARVGETRRGEAFELEEAR